MAESVFELACARAPEGIEIAAVAAADPRRIALWSERGEMTFAELNAAANRLAQRLRTAGLERGDAVALVCGNRNEFAVVRFATHRAGLRLTPVNWHLTPEEIRYVVENCEAKALFLDTRVADAAAGCARIAALALRVSIGGELPGYTQWHEALAGMDERDIADPALGNTMMYTSGTTGRPKGVYRALPDPRHAAHLQQLLTAVFQFDPMSGDDRALATGPLYHTGPFALCFTTPLTAGIGVVLMDHWDPEKMLALIEQHRITHTFCVPTMFSRLLQLPATTRLRHDLSSLRFVIHGAAPCSIDTKQRMMDWWGPILWEMFAGTEGQGTIVSPQEWLARPGTVGRPAQGQLRILDDAGNEVPRGQTGTIYLVNPGGSAFEYFRDPQKTASALREGYFTAGDIGHLDADGYLFLNGRSAEVIISGGVNIYPAEIENVLLGHPKVADAAVFGIPHPDWGEEVKAVVELVDGVEPSDEVASEILTYCGEKLAKFKLPRSVDFTDEMPRDPNGKLYKRKLRDPYWEGHEAKI